MTIVKNVTSTQQVLTRAWNDIDPKVRNAGYTAVLLLLGIAAALISHKASLAASTVAAGAALLPVLVAYVTTSKHRALILKDIATAEQVVDAVKPVIVAAVPEAGPIIEDAESLAAAVQAGVVAETTAIPTLAAPVAAPVQ